MNKVGDIVDYNGVKLKVVLCDTYNYCGNCFSIKEAMQSTKRNALHTKFKRR